MYQMIAVPSSEAIKYELKPLNAELNPICHLLALLGAHPILHVSGIKVKHCSTGQGISETFN
jgi:hypothetical protein